MPLEGLGRSHLHDGNRREGLDYLSQALTIYQRIGAPTAQRVQEILQQHGQPSTTVDQPAASGERNWPRTPSHPTKPSRDKPSAGSAAEQPDLRGRQPTGTKQRKRA